MPDNSADVKVGKMIAVIVEKGEDWKNVQVPQIEEQSAPSKKADTKQASAVTPEKTSADSASAALASQ